MQIEFLGVSELKKMIAKQKVRMRWSFIKSLDLFFKEVHGDRSGEFLRGYWSLKDKMIADKLCKGGKKGEGVADCP